MQGRLKVFFYVHCGRSAEDRLKVRGRPPQKICFQELMANRITNSAYGVWRRAEDLILPAPRKIRGRPAEDLRGPPRKAQFQELMVKKITIQLTEFRGGLKICFSPHRGRSADDPRKTPAEDISSFLKRARQANRPPAS